ncbi:hypothetical protein C8Q76DRAFT_597324, partial [Earliella scabrosa]
FGPDQTQDGILPDLTITTADCVHFHVHSHRLLQISHNHFDARLPSPSPSISVPEHAGPFSVTLHIMYNKSCAALSPTLEVLDDSLAALVKYGAPISTLAVSPLPLYTLLLAHAPSRALETYALAAHHALDAVAVATSAHLLTFNIIELPDGLSCKMGPRYLWRLLELHRRRREALKTIVLTVPRDHAPTATCDGAWQGGRTAAWACASAALAWDAGPGTSAEALCAAFERAYEAVRCGGCRETVRVRIDEVVQEWSAVQ